MIFVTVGTYSFDRLIKEIDSLCESGFFNDEVVCQIGSGKYIPKYCKYFRYQPDLSNMYDEAKFIICHGGTGSTSDCIRKSKHFIAVANIELADNHQTEFLSALSEEVGFTWTNETAEIKYLFQKANENNTYQPIETLFDDLNGFLNTE